MAATAPERTVESRVLGVVREVLNLDEEPKDLDVSIAGDGLALDSLEQLSLFMALEDEFGARIRQEEAEQISTLREIVDCIRERLGAPHAG